MRELVKRLLRLVLGDYSAYRIYARDPDAPAFTCSDKNAGYVVREIAPEDLLASPDAAMREQAGYLGEQAVGFGCFHEGRIVGVCFYWFGARYLKRNFWPLKDKEAKLVQLFTLAAMRGREVAPCLISRSGAVMQDKGFERIYARIWHSNTPSLRAFARAGWIDIATVFEINPLRTAKPLRFTASRSNTRTT